MRRSGRVGAVLVVLVALAAAAAGRRWLEATPAGPPLALPSTSIALDSASGQDRLTRAERADLTALDQAFRPQQTRSFCGVASAATVLRAAGRDVDQDSFFTADVQDVRPRWRTLVFGMTLEDFGAQLEAHGIEAQVVHASGTDVDGFREAVRANAARADDWLVVNYDRAVLHQVGAGHFSPVGAWDPASDSVLLLDPAAYKYPAHWVALPELFRAMDTQDGSSGRHRGWVELRER